MSLLSREPARETFAEHGPESLDVICVGEALWKLAPGGGSSWSFRPAGGAANVAAGLARAGLRVGLATTLVDDAFGRELYERVRSTGVLTGGVRLVPARAGLVVLDALRTARPVVAARSEEQIPIELPPEWSASLLLVSGLSPVVPFAASLCKAARMARRRGAMVVVDINARWHLFAGHDPRATRSVLREADVVRCSEEDLAILGQDVRQLRADIRPEAVVVMSNATGDAWATGPFGEVVRGGAHVGSKGRSGDALTAMLCKELVRAGSPSERRTEPYARALGVQA